MRRAPSVKKRLHDLQDGRCPPVIECSLGVREGVVATDRLLEQGKALVHALEAGDDAMGWVAEEIPSASQHIEEDRAAVWMSKN